MAYGSVNSLQTISPDGVVPKCRMESAIDTQSFVRRLILDDSQRSLKRAKVNGLVDGNPPYSRTKLVAANRADAANVNWGRARAYMESGSGSFYDLFAEAPGYITVRTDYGTDEQKEQWSDIISEEADRVFRESKEWDYEMSISQWNMVLHGQGPLMFEDAHRPFPKAFLAGDLKVPEMTKSESAYWDVCMIQATYYPPELYAFIKDADAAEQVGWRVEYTKNVIANAMDIRSQQGINYEWEFYEQQLKNNTLSYYSNSKVCRIAHVYWKEFDGRITHAIVERNMASPTPRPDNDSGQPEYMFLSIGRYKNFDECVHAMYFDHGNGGYHHSVTGLGVKMYAAMNYENRLLCNLADKGFTAKTLTRPTTASVSQKLQLSRIGDYELLPPGFEVQQNPISGMVGEGVAVYDLLSGINSNTLSTYRQPTMQKRGNPVTKFEKQLEAEVFSALSKTQYNRYYAQLDALYREIYRRLTDLNTPDERCKEFQERCIKRGVPREALGRTDKIQATRVVGQGSAFMRKQAIDSIMQVVSALPEDGRDNLVRDKIAAEAGQAAVLRYYPSNQSSLATDQQAEAMLQVASMKVGVPPVVTSTQNPVVFSMLFIKAAVQAIQSLQQGGNPMEVLRFLNVCGPAAAAHLSRFANDPTRKQIHDQLEMQLGAVALQTDKLKAALVQMGQQQQQQTQQTAQVMNDIQLKNLQVQSDIALKNAKAKAQMEQRAEKMKFDMALQDIGQAHDMTLSRIETAQGAAKSPPQ